MNCYLSDLRVCLLKFILNLFSDIMRLFNSHVCTNFQVNVNGEFSIDCLNVYVMDPP